MQRPILAYDFTVLENRPWTGVERYALAMLRHLPAAMPDAELCALWRRAPRDEIAGELSGWRVHTDESALPRPLWRRFVLPRLARRLKARLLVAPVSHVPEISGLVSCRTIHDIPGRDLEELEKEPWFKAALKARWRQSDVPTIFPSDATRKRFGELQPSFTAPARVIRHGVDPSWFQCGSEKTAGSKLPLLVVGTVRERRMPGVVNEAMAQLRNSHPEAELRWLGHCAIDVSSYKEIRFLGPLDDEAKRREFERARILVCPSLVEGFGLPMLEGMAAGLVVVSADHAAGREVGSSFPIFYDGRSADALAQALRDAAQRVSTGGYADEQRAHARQFSWQDSAAEHAAFFIDLMKTGKR